MSGTRIFAGGRVQNPRLPMVGGVVSLFDGLITNGGYAQASYVDGWNRTEGFEIETVFRTPAAAQAYEVARRYQDAKGWFLRVTADGNIAFSIGYGSNTALNAYTTTSAPLKDTWGGKMIGLRVRVDTTAKRIRRWLSLDAGTTWTELGTGSTIADGDASKGVQPTLAPLIVPSGVDAQDGITVVRYVVLRTLSGDSIIGVTFGTTWPPYTSSYQSPSGSTWTLAQGAFVGSTTVASPA